MYSDKQIHVELDKVLEGGAVSAVLRHVINNLTTI